MVRLCARLVVCLLGLAAAAGPSAATSAGDLASPVGLWTPLDWNTGKPMGLIRIYEERGELYGRIEPVPGENEDNGKRCTRCTDERKNQPYIGLVLMRHLRLHNGEYDGGDILDPGTGSVYGCKLRLIDGGHRLLMRGFLGISLLGRSQTWQRVE
jgi:uncharacterized protein (DUF2147 family)